MTPIAIVGMGCLFPGAADLEQFWHNIRDGVDAISTVPPGRWDPIFYDPNSSDVDRFYCNRGGFIDDNAEFDPLAFGVLPNVVAAADPEQLLTLKVGIDALRDAGYQNLEMVPRHRTGVVIGKGAYPNAAGHKLQQHVSILPQLLASLRDLLPDLSEEALDDVRRRAQAQMVGFGADAAAGIIPNLVASRLANRLNLHGPAYVVDAACASFLVALQQAVAALRHDEADLMIVGAVHLCHDPALWATFCQLGALSRAGIIKPFSSSADGTIAGEGVGVLVVKRLADALAGGDRIYAVIEGVGTSSDGRATGLLAPSSEGQQIAVERAWKHIQPLREQIGLLEAHGTGTLAGDAAELETVAACFGPAQGNGRAVMGSVKSMIGHAMPAAGAAATIKAALSIYHGILPPSLHCSDPHPLLASTRFRVTQTAESWHQPPASRIAGVNAFGFGGINGHAVLRGHAASTVADSTAPAVVPPDVLTLDANTIDDLLARIDAGERDNRPGGGRVRLAIVEPDARKLVAARKIVASGKPHRGRQQIFFSAEGLATNGGKIAFLFPGVDGAFHPRGADLARFFKLPLPAHGDVAEPMAFAMNTLQGVMAFNAFLFDVLTRLSIRADAIAGHSLGEFNALVASGRLQGVDDIRDLVYEGSDSWPANVIFLAAACDADTMRQALTGLIGVHLTHDNCPSQAIACGLPEGLEQLRLRFQQRNILCQILPFSGGFHSPYLLGELEQGIDTTAERPFAAPEVPVWSAATAAPYPEDEEGARAVAAAFQLQPVRFRELVDNLYRDGHRIFIQVGTGSISGLVGDTLRSRPHLVIAANHPTRPGLDQLTSLSAALWAEGVSHDTSLLQASKQMVQRTSDARVSRKVRLNLGAQMFRLPAIACSVRDRCGYELPQEEALRDDPIEKALYETLREIEEARHEVGALLRRRTPAEARTFVEKPGAATPQVDFKVSRRLDLASLPFVADHELYPQRPGWPIVADRHPIIPLTMEIELIREAVAPSLPGWKVVELRDVQAYRWLAIAEPVDITIRLLSRADGTIEAEIQDYFRAELTLAEHYPSAPSRPVPALVGARRAKIDASTMYGEGWMFHGPAYRGIVALDSVGDNGVDVSICAPSGMGGVADNMGQAAAYWLQEQEVGSLAMPVGLRRLRLFGDEPVPGTLLSCHSRITSIGETDCLFDIWLHDADGRTVIAIEGWNTRRYPFDRETLRRLRRPHVEGVSTTLADGAVLFRDIYDSAVARDMLARVYLSAPELQQYDKLPPRRRRQWLNGRCAAKDAVLGFLRRTGRSGIFPKEMRIENDVMGCPHVIPNITDNVPQGIRVSLTHKKGLAAAIAGEEQVGIDVEEIVERDAAFAETIAAEREISLLQDDESGASITRAWVAKEAAAKASQTGLGGDPKAWVIEARQGSGLRVNGRWVRTSQIDNFIIGWTASGPAFDNLADTRARSEEGQTA